MLKIYALILILYFISSIIIYRFVVLKFKQANITPPSFFAFMKQGVKFDQPVKLYSPIRYILGFVILLGGLAFILMDILLIQSKSHSLDIPFIIFLVSILGFSMGFIYTGFRLLRMKTYEERLYGPLASQAAKYYIPIILSLLLFSMWLIVGSR